MKRERRYTHDTHTNDPYTWHIHMTHTHDTFTHAFFVKEPYFMGQCTRVPCVIEREAIHTWHTPMIGQYTIAWVYVSCVYSLSLHKEPIQTWHIHWHIHMTHTHDTYAWHIHTCLFCKRALFHGAMYESALCNRERGDTHMTHTNDTDTPHTSYAATRCNTLQHTAIRYNTLQHTATHCNASHVDPPTTLLHCNTLQHAATRCNTLQHTAAHCNTLQHTATHCNTLQHTATHRT